MTAERIVPVILAGGVGSRLWPVSTPDLPKQFLPLKTGGTCFSNTVDRVADPVLFSAPTIICAADHALIISKMTSGKGVRVICEPVGRNTAPAFCVGGLAAVQDSDLLLFLPSDHDIPDADAFRAAAARAMTQAREGYIVTFGIKPQFAHNQYGYIRKGKNLVGGAYRVVTFTEKPDVQTAESYIRSGDYLWNSGIFMMRRDVLLKEMATRQTDVYECCQRAYAARRREDNILVLDTDEFSRVPRISFDYAVMEHTDKAVVLEVDFVWRDMGGWDTVMEFDVCKKFIKCV